MSAPRKVRTMYLHTLDGQPANFTTDSTGGYLYFVGARRRVKLVASRRQIQREQQRAIADAWKDTNQRQWAGLKRYGYVLVEVPQ